MGVTIGCLDTSIRGHRELIDILSLLHGTESGCVLHIYALNSAFQLLTGRFSALRTIGNSWTALKLRAQSVHYMRNTCNPGCSRTLLSPDVAYLSQSFHYHHSEADLDGISILPTTAFSPCAYLRFLVHCHAQIVAR